MVDKAETVAFQGGGQPPKSPVAPVASGQTQSQDAAQPQYVTTEEAQRIAQAAAEEAFRRAQGLYEKGRVGIEKKVQAELKNLEKALELQRKAGIAVSPEQENQLKQQVINQAFTEQEQPPQGTFPTEQPGQAAGEEEPPDPITAEAWQMMSTAGVDILEGDPEYELLKENGTALEFLSSVQEAITKKQARLGTTSPAGGAPTRAPTNQGAGGQPVSSYEGRRGMDLLTEYYKGQG